VCGWVGWNGWWLWCVCVGLWGGGVGWGGANTQSEVHALIVVLSRVYYIITLGIV